MLCYVVLDTNVLVSALISGNPDSATVLVVAKMLAGELVPVYSADILREYREVLHRKKFRFDSAQIDLILWAVARFGLSVEPSATGAILPDMKDLPFYEVVMEKRKSDDAYLVTGNRKHFPTEPFIVTPKEMLDILAGAE